MFLAAPTRHSMDGHPLIRDTVHTSEVIHAQYWNPWEPSEESNYSSRIQ